MGRGFGLMEWGLVTGLAVLVGISLIRKRPRFHLTEVERTRQKVGYWHDQLRDEFDDHPVIGHFCVSADSDGRMHIMLWNYRDESASVNMERFLHDPAGAICDATYYLERRMAS